jgi:hypothetical protein
MTMNPDTSPHAIAERIRGILGGHDRGMVEATARRLGVSEVALRMSIDEGEPHPTVEVLMAIVREHGVDPCWLVTGTYDAATHRAAMSDEATASKRLVADLIARQLTPKGSEAVSREPQLRLEA